MYCRITHSTQKARAYLRVSTVILSCYPAQTCTGCLLGLRLCCQSDSYFPSFSPHCCPYYCVLSFQSQYMNLLAATPH